MVQKLIDSLFSILKGSDKMATKPAAKKPAAKKPAAKKQIGRAHV